MTSKDGSTNADTTCVTVSTARALIDTNPDVLVVDVRTPGEFSSAHIPGAINLPVDQVNAHLKRIVTDAGGRMLLICQSGNRARQAHTALVRAGLTDVMVLDGGMNAWITAGAPTVSATTRPRWAMERQVRLLAGGIVAASTLASLWWPRARFLAGGIGAGLTVAAITDSCALGALLSKLPYNRTGDFDVEQAIARLRTGESAA